MKTLAKIKKFHPELIPPTGSVAYGVTPDGKQLYRLVRQRSTKRRKMEIGPDGREREVWRKNQMTGEPLYPVNEPVPYEEELIFYLESEGNGQVNMVKYTPPSPEELARAQKAQRVQDMQEQLAEALVDADITPSSLLDMLRGRKAAPAPKPAEPVVEYPVHLGGPRWQLSNGSVVSGKKVDAQRQEAELQAAIADAQASAAITPEE